MTRTWKIQMNLDEFNALCGVAFTEADRSALLGGLQLGCNAGTLPEGCSSTLRAAYEVGMGWRMEAEGYKARRSEGGKASAEARKAKYGTAVPNSVRTVLEVCSNQSTIHNLQSTNTPLPPRGKTQKAIPPELLPRLEALCRNWPGSFQKDGQTHRLPKLSNAQDLWDRMTKFFPKDDPEDMIAAGESHISPACDDGWEWNTKPQGFTIAMTNFYGQQARWKEFRAVR